MLVSLAHVRGKSAVFSARRLKASVCTKSISPGGTCLLSITLIAFIALFMSAGVIARLVAPSVVFVRVFAQC